MQLTRSPSPDATAMVRLFLHPSHPAVLFATPGVLDRLLLYFTFLDQNSTQLALAHVIYDTRRSIASESTLFTKTRKR
jgi:hypothetical protein